MLGVNQGIIMVLAVVVIGGLVGSGGLGYEVAQGLVRGQFGQGVIASLAILALGIALDRVTQGHAGALGRTSIVTNKQRRSTFKQAENGHSKEGRMRDRLGTRRSRLRGARLVALVALAVVAARLRSAAARAPRPAATSS